MNYHCRFQASGRSIKTGVNDRTVGFGGISADIVKTIYDNDVKLESGEFPGQSNSHSPGTDDEDINSSHMILLMIDLAAFFAFLRGLPEGTVLYQHWLGWHYAYYLFDAPVYVAYWPTPAWLARDVQAFGDREPRYVAFPSWESSARVERALADVGYELQPVLTTTRRDGSFSFTIYRVRNQVFRATCCGCLKPGFLPNCSETNENSINQP